MRKCHRSLINKSWLCVWFTKNATFYWIHLRIIITPLFFPPSPLDDDDGLMDNLMTDDTWHCSRVRRATKASEINNVANLILTRLRASSTPGNRSLKVSFDGHPLPLYTLAIIDIILFASRCRVWVKLQTTAIELFCHPQQYGHRWDALHATPRILSKELRRTGRLCGRSM